MQQPQETISREALLNVLYSLEGEEKSRFEQMLSAMGVKVPVRKKASGYTVQKIKIQQEYYLHWKVTCQLCSFKEDLWFYMCQSKELGGLISKPIYNPEEYSLVNWKTEGKRRQTCPRCLSHLKGVPHKEVCEKLIEARSITAGIIF